MFYNYSSFPLHTNNMAKRMKRSVVPASSVKFDNTKNSYTYKRKYVQFFVGKNRIYEIPKDFFHSCISYTIKSEDSRGVVLHEPIFTKPDGVSVSETHVQSFLGNIRLFWILVYSSPDIFKKGISCNYSKIVKDCNENCPMACLKGFVYSNEFGDIFKTKLDGKTMVLICDAYDQVPPEIYINAAFLLSDQYKGHSNSGDTAIKVSGIRSEDIRPYKLLVREGLLKCQVIRGIEYLKEPSVIKWENDIVTSFNRFERCFSGDEIIVENSSDASQILIEEQLKACKVCLNYPVSYVVGFPGTGKTTVLTKILEYSNGSLILTPSHTARKVVEKRAKLNSPDSKFSVEVIAFAIRNLSKWGNDGGSEDLNERNKAMMEKFVTKNGVEIETLVIEEASMASLEDVSVILDICSSTIPSIKRVVFCGDDRQLQSVSKGRVLSDIIKSSSIPGTKLVTNHRSGNALSNNLRHILTSKHREMKFDETFEIEEYDDHCFEVDDDRYGRRRLLAKDQISEKFIQYTEKGKQVHILCYTNLEASRINTDIKKFLFGDCDDAFPVGCKIRVKDIENISGDNVCRNDLLEIVSKFDPENKKAYGFVVKYWNRSISDENEPFSIEVTDKPRYTFELGYATTVHSTQGDEVQYIIVHGIPNSVFFSRDAFYTSVSRGKEKVIVISSKTDNKNWRRIVEKSAIVRVSTLVPMIDDGFGK